MIIMTATTSYINQLLRYLDKFRIFRARVIVLIVKNLSRHHENKPTVKISVLDRSPRRGDTPYGIVESQGRLCGFLGGRLLLQSKVAEEAEQQHHYEG